MSGSRWLALGALCLSLLAIVLARRVIPESRHPLERRLDWTGAALSAAGLIAGRSLRRLPASAADRRAWGSSSRCQAASNRK